MDCENRKQEGSAIPYDVLFVASFTPCLADGCQVRWKEAKISVTKYEKPGLSFPARWEWALTVSS